VFLSIKLISKDTSNSNATLKIITVHNCAPAPIRVLFRVAVLGLVRSWCKVKKSEKMHETQLFFWVTQLLDPADIKDTFDLVGVDIHQSIPCTTHDDHKKETQGVALFPNISHRLSQPQIISLSDQSVGLLSVRLQRTLTNPKPRWNQNPGFGSLETTSAVNIDS